MEKEENQKINNIETGFTIKSGSSVSTTGLVKKLSLLGYTNVSPSNVAGVGEFAKRGGVIDIWLERYKLPVRIDLIGEEIESIYLFNILTQEKIKVLKNLYIITYGITPRLAPKWTKKKKFAADKYERLFLSEIQKGDLVVHIDHGIGKFIELVNKQSSDQRFFAPPNPPRETRFARNGASAKSLPAPRSDSDRGVPMESQKSDRTFAFSEQLLVVEYAGKDKLFVPVDQIERLTKYIGVAGRKPRLSRLGTAAWEQTKQRVSEEIAKYAKELLELYAKRELAKRSAYPQDTPWQKALEQSFEFQETGSQLKAIEEVKKDLESFEPMDRILVGDVGFGKTEVAIRAAFKVVQSGKQVAMLVPTTILADQHYFLFKGRLKEFPVEIGLLSRFQSDSEQEETVHKLNQGKIDIVVGTHRLLSSDIKFKDLGLLVVDEEHRFGVRHKEKLMAMKPDVDVLSMSATPIPRSLQMALAKIRKMSVLQEAPEGRKPITTFVGEHDKEKIKGAIQMEIDRGGQVYYVFNRVELIANKAAEIARLLPRARVVYAHGQMDKKMQNSNIKSQNYSSKANNSNLEKVMKGFYNKEYDVLVCTTIIGSGIDMPNVNTIIIENAHRFGLADLYQLRGRVGRSEREAYAYLFYPQKFVPEGVALERLVAISQAAELGAGFKIVKQDLEIRGAGNLLGVQQSGNIAIVGLELYIQLLSQFVEKLKKA